MELKYNFHDVDQPEPLRQYCDARIGSLDRFTNEILHASIDFHHSHHHKKGSVFHVDVKVVLPKKVFYAKKEAASFNEAVDRVSEALEKQILRYTERRDRITKLVKPFKSLSDRIWRS